MSVVTINLANRDFKIAYNPASKDRLFKFVSELDYKISDIMQKNSFATLELVLVILSLRLEEQLFCLNQKNEQLERINSKYLSDFMAIKKKLENVAHIL